MDPDPESDIIKNDVVINYTIGEMHAMTELKPDLQFYDDGHIKMFSATSLLENTENMLTSSAAFDEDYNLISGSVSIIELSSDEFKSISNHQKELSAIGEVLKRRKSTTLTSICDKNERFPMQYQKNMYKEVNDEISDLRLSLATFNAYAIDDKHLRSITDRMNNFLINCGTRRGLSVEAFKEMERAMTAVKKEKQQPAKVLSFENLTTRKSNEENQKFA